MRLDARESLELRLAYGRAARAGGACRAVPTEPLPIRRDDNRVHAVAVEHFFSAPALDAVKSVIPLALPAEEEQDDGRYLRA